METSVKTIDRLVAVLDSFSRDKPAWSLSELSTALALPKSTLHRFLVGLESHGIMHRGAEDGKWRLGHQLFVWGSLAIESTGLRQLAAPIMRELALQTGETVLLTEYRAGQVVYVDKVETSHSVRLAAEVGSVRPPHAGASSKVLMAYLPRPEVEAIIEERGLPKLCTRTITDPIELQAELRHIREQGYAVSYEETDIGAWGIATPIRNWRGEVVAAVGIAGPAVRYSDRQTHEYVNLCCDAAARISARCGADAPARAGGPAPSVLQGRSSH